MNSLKINIIEILQSLITVTSLNDIKNRVSELSLTYSVSLIKIL